MNHRTALLVFSMSIGTLLCIQIAPRAHLRHNLAISHVQAQMQIPTATPHMTCILPNSIIETAWVLEGEIMDGPGQTRVITVPSIHPRCQSVASHSNPMFALVDNVVRLKIWNDDGVMVFNNDVNLFLHNNELTSPDCTSPDGYELHPRHNGRFEATIYYQCCYSCYQTATPTPGTATPPTP